ncbi:hypothetical protein DY000_02058535 [Brassica cretica]|uniref:Retropepsins domain-containing protein n=1 Tax=Brassica cretica TaxID=69181 RepID=A0ABQ7AV94_BRACR|nr:hypothetical protein DY000_02058535 [Brassica cretica]
MGLKEPKPIASNQARKRRSRGPGERGVVPEIADGTIDPTPIRSDCAESINLDLFRSVKPIASRKVNALNEQSCTSREATDDSTIINCEDTIQKGEIVTFYEHKTINLDKPHDNALVIALEVEGIVFSKILVDTGSAVDIISQNTLRSLKQPIPIIKQEATPLASFEGKLVRPLGIILLTTRTHDLELKTEFTVVSHLMPFDAIVGCPWLHQMRALPSVYNQCVKFLSSTSEKTILGSQKQARACYMSEFRKMPQKEENIPLARDLSVKEQRREFHEEICHFGISDAEQSVRPI